jgi:hypothetical protein
MISIGSGKINGIFYNVIRDDDQLFIVTKVRDYTSRNTLDSPLCCSSFEQKPSFFLKRPLGRGC